MCDWDLTHVSYSALKESQSDAQAVKRQSDGLAREYDSLLNEHQLLQVTDTRHRASAIHTPTDIKLLTFPKQSIRSTK